MRTSTLSVLSEVYHAWSHRLDFRDAIDEHMAQLGVRRDLDAIHVFVIVGEPGVAIWRAFTPYLELGKDPRFVVRMSLPGSFSVADLDWSDVIVFQRAASRQTLAIVERAQAAGKKVVFEIDDYLDEIPKYNPARYQVAKTNLVERSHHMMAAADLVTVSTRYLAGVYGPLARRTAVLPNCVNVEHWQEQGPFVARDDRVLVGWAGSNSHWEDVALVAPALIELSKEHPQMWLQRGGYSGPDFRMLPTGQAVEADPLETVLERFPNNRRFNVGWEPHPYDLGKYLGHVHVAIAPLRYSTFNSCKSNVKILEAGVCRVPTVATEIECYADDGERSPTKLVRNNRLDRWMRAIEEYLLDADARREDGERAYRYVVDNYDIEKRVGLWADTLIGLVTPGAVQMSVGGKQFTFVPLMAA